MESNGPNQRVDVEDDTAEGRHLGVSQLARPRIAPARAPADQRNENTIEGANVGEDRR